MIGSLTTTELRTRDAHGRRVAVQRYRGNGPVRAGDQYAVLVDVPRMFGTRRLVDVVTAGYVECVTPARGRVRGSWKVTATTETDGRIIEATTRDAAALLLAAELAPGQAETPAPAPAAVVVDQDADVIRIDPKDRPSPAVASLKVVAATASVAEADTLAHVIELEQQLVAARADFVQATVTAVKAWDTLQLAMFDV